MESKNICNTIAPLNTNPIKPHLAHQVKAAIANPTSCVLSPKRTASLIMWRVPIVTRTLLCIICHATEPIYYPPYRTHSSRVAANDMTARVLYMTT